MQIFRLSDLHPAPADSRTFTGAARVSRLATDDERSSARVYRVAFDPGARLHWHTHSGPQWLFVLEGRCRVQVWGEPPLDLAAGDSVCIDRDEKHWHGAVPDAPGTHIAVNLGATTTWMEEVTEESYAGR
ncbi:MAG TPA: cupin domain-containing protein [Vicinamibacterales bacterium]|nr:cupin domain-containing protein [Vicinamibacterales bacterium]